MKMKALILIGGLGTRLRPFTCHTPKPLLPIVNRPFLEYQFELIRRHGIKEVILCMAYLPGEFKNYFGTGRKWGINIHYVEEKEPLGTGGAIGNAAQLIDGPTLIFNGDILTDVDLSGMMRFHAKNNAFITIALTRVKDPTIYGLVETDGKNRIKRFLEKPSWDEVTCNTINAGIYIFEPEAMQFIPKGLQFSVERNLFPNLLAKKYGLYGYTFNTYWMDIGTTEKYLASHFDLLQQRVAFALPGKKARPTLWAGKSLKIGNHVEINGTVACGKNVCIGDFVQLHGNVCLGDEVSIGRGSYISDSVIHSGTRIGEGVRIETSLLGRKCLVEPNAVIGANTALGNETVIRKYSKI